MIKTIMLAHRKPGLSRKEFYDHWENIHGPLFAKHAPYVKKYVQNHLIEVPGTQNHLISVQGKEYDVDGIVEFWYDDMESLQKSRQAMTPAAIAELDQDADTYAIKPPLGFQWLVEEHVIVDKTK